MNLQLSGMIPPVVSPLTPDRRPDIGAVERLTAHVQDGGAAALFILGSCGEGPTLEPGVASEIARAYVGAVAGSVPVLAGIGETSTERALRAGRDFEQIGVDALVVMAPMYFDTDTDSAVLRHVTAIAETTSLPLVVYNIPHLTHHPITPRALREIAAIDSVIALKESSGDWETYAALAEVAGAAGLRVFQGAEALIARSLAAGAHGAVPGIANVVPGLAAELVQAGLSGHTTRAAALQAQLDEVCAVYRPAFWLTSLKAALAELGIVGSTAGQALAPPDADGLSEVHRILTAAGLPAPSSRRQKFPPESC
ncbi:dihydrodipicolinate synthase family protein [Jiangella sp. DSM 45060]|uniref:dihydrodipicolinate synthase family protein n=1 Tax=Jiangella sp. DSM 45060 TaxID=1798224 RepID=UPI00087CC179|nr:dihydrodipicolinate synthase family protein [Jiangella sp. DSM 45060]SDT47278.1 4-hydroxy-tetrahydrodipicolinate synthase [Jiangella sp. DSM 45060]